MATARAALESLLRDRKLDGTLTAGQPWVTEPENRVAATGIAAIDEPLGGGLRRGHLSEIVGPRSSGRTTILCRLCAAAIARGEVVALVDTCDRFDPASAAEAGVDLSRLLWIRERGDAARALKALNLVVQAGGFGLVAFDLADVSPTVVRQFPYTTWMRLSRVIEGSQTALVLLGADRIARSPGGVTVTLTDDGGGLVGGRQLGGRPRGGGPRGDRPRGGGPHGRWSGTADRARFLTTLEINPRIVGAR
jgi:recombination protein RecA